MKLFWKIYCAVLLAFVAVVGLSSYVTSAQRISAAETSITEEHRIMGLLVSSNIERSRLESRWPFETLRRLSEHHDFIFWWIVGDNGVIHLADKASFIGSRTADYFPHVTGIFPEGDVFPNRPKGYGLFLKTFRAGDDRWTFWLGFSTRAVSGERASIISTTVTYSAAACLLLGLVLYLTIIHFVSPVKGLVAGAERIGKGDLSHQVEIESDDEFGDLARSFNRMAGDLKRSTTSIDNLNREIAQRKRAQVELKTSQEKLLEVARKAGMAEVAADVLHNVGNVLNSINVSATVITEKVAKSELPNLQKVATIINEHIHEIGTFLTQHPQGKHIPVYLTEVSKCLQAEQTDMISKLQVLTDNVQHIKDIISTQQAYAKVSGVEMRASLGQLVEDAIRINSSGLQRHGTRIVREFSELPDVELDKQRVLQILVNLISNAKYALSDSKKREKLMTIRLYKRNEDRFRIEVADNGVGISRENLTKIFSHGFTTKEGGHGFGLHGSALAARELGGSLTVHSDGAEQGATFTLELPFKPMKVAS